MSEKIGCVVVTLRTGREALVVKTPLGDVVIEVEPKTNVRSKVIVRAPESIRIERRKQEGADL